MDPMSTSTAPQAPLIPQLEGPAPIINPPQPIPQPGHGSGSSILVSGSGSGGLLKGPALEAELRRLKGNMAALDAERAADQTNLPDGQPGVTSAADGDASGQAGHGSSVEDQVTKATPEPTPAPTNATPPSPPTTPPPPAPTPAPPTSPPPPSPHPTPEPKKRKGGGKKNKKNGDDLWAGFNVPKNHWKADLGLIKKAAEGSSANVSSMQDTVRDTFGRIKGWTPVEAVLRLCDALAGGTLRAVVPVNERPQALPTDEIVVRLEQGAVNEFKYRIDQYLALIDLNSMFLGREALKQKTERVLGPGQDAAFLFYKSCCISSRACSTREWEQSVLDDHVAAAALRKEWKAKRKGGQRLQEWVDEFGYGILLLMPYTYNVTYLKRETIIGARLLRGVIAKKGSPLAAVFQHFYRVVEQHHD